MSKMKILLVEDDIALSKGICIALTTNELQVEACSDLGHAGLALIKDIFDLLILDINLPDGNGLDFLIKLRETSLIPVIMLTANNMETDIVAGLEFGANDYITKPFSLAVLRARVNAQLRQHSTYKQEQGVRVEIDRFRFDFNRLEFFKEGELIELSKTEQKLLKYLIENQGITLTREKLLERIWSDGADYVDENALSVAIKRLRDKLEDDSSHPQYIKTVYGIGYVWTVKK